MSKRKSLSDKLTYFYIRKIKKWMFCPACQNGKMSINKSGTIWTCEDCGYQLANAVFEDDYVFWFCDECGTYLNNQEGFDRHAQKHICQNCGYENDTTFDNIKGTCSDCGKLIPDPDATLCLDCKQARREKAKQRLIKAGKVAGAVAVAGAVYLASQSPVEDNIDCTDFISGDKKGGNSMSKYKVLFDGELEDEVFSSYEDADEYGLYLQSCCREGAETLNLSNPGDYDYDEDNFEVPDYEVVEV